MLEYEIVATSENADGSVVSVKDASVVLDTSAEGRRDAPNPAELLLTALAACMIKGVRRAATMNHFEVGRIEIRIHGTRQDRPPKMESIRYEIRVETNESEHRLDLLHRNVLKFGTVTNTIAPGTSLEGELRRM